MLPSNSFSPIFQTPISWFARWILDLRRFALGLLASMCVVASLRAANDWDPLDPAEWTQTQSQIEPDAHAEIMIKRVRYDLTTRDVYFRIRIYDTKGVERFAKIDIENVSGSRARRIEARTLKPDGTILTLKKEDIFEREVVKTRGDRVRAQSFAPPGLEPGVVIEYRFTRVFDNYNFSAYLNFQENNPVRLCEFAVRFPQIGGYVRGIFMNHAAEPLKMDKQQFFNFRKENLPSLIEEPFAPDFDGVGATSILYLSFTNGDEPSKYWKDTSKELADETRRIGKFAKRAEKLLPEILNGSEDFELKLQKLHDFCRTKLVNLDRDTVEVARILAGKVPKIDTVQDVLKHRMGNDRLINETFIALAIAAGLDARIARVGDREAFPFSPSVTEKLLMDRFVPVLLVNDSWVVTDPGATFLPVSMLSPEYSFSMMCVGNKDEAVLINSPGTEANRSVRIRTANLDLSSSGELSGTVEEQLSGYWGQSWFDQHGEESLEDARRALQSTLRDSLPGAEVTEYEVSGREDLTQELVVSYHLKVPDFAERTGSRLFVAPAVFQRGQTALFTAEKRENRILFRYPRAEVDQVRITYPENFDLEAPSAPAPVDFSGVGRFKSEIKVKPKSRLIMFNRWWALDTLMHPVDDYPRLKQQFESLQSSDNHTLTLKRKPVVDDSDEDDEEEDEEAVDGDVADAPDAR